MRVRERERETEREREEERESLVRVVRTKLCPNTVGTHKLGSLEPQLSSILFGDTMVPNIE